MLFDEEGPRSGDALGDGLGVVTPPAPLLLLLFIIIVDGGGGLLTGGGEFPDMVEFMGEGDPDLTGGGFLKPPGGGVFVGGPLKLPGDGGGALNGGGVGDDICVFFSFVVCLFVRFCF